MSIHEGHERHLCKLVVGDLEDIEIIKSLVKEPKYICVSCGRAAHNSDNLCSPTNL